MPMLETLVLKFSVHGQSSIIGIEHLTNLKEVQFSGEKHKMEDELEKLKEENARRKCNDSNQLTVKVTYE